MRPLTDHEVEVVMREFDAFLREDFDLGTHWVDLPTTPDGCLTTWADSVAEFDSLFDLMFAVTAERFCGQAVPRDEMIRWFDPPHMRDHAALRDVPKSRRGVRGMANWLLPRRAKLLLRPVSIGGRACVAAGVFDVLQTLTGDLARRPFGPSTRLTDVLGGHARSRLARRIEARFSRSVDLPPAFMNMHYDGLPVIACGLSVLLSTLGFGGGATLLTAIGLVLAAESVRQSVVEVRRRRSLTFGELSRSIAAAV